MIRFLLNDAEHSTSLPPGTVVLDYIRNHQHLNGTKIGCREGDCGACTILIGELIEGAVRYRSATSCLTALGSIRNKHVVTIEGINLPGRLTPVQSAMCEHSATQCGFCTPGFVVSMTGFCLQSNASGYEKAVEAVDGNICRCTGYKSIQRSLVSVSKLMEHKEPGADQIDFCISQDIIPAYFKKIPLRLTELKLPSVSRAGLARILGGGTDLYVQQHEAMVESEIRFFQAESSAEVVRLIDEMIILDGSATVSDLLYSPMILEAIPGIDKYLSLVSSTPIRNIATVAGNFVNASPIGDLTILFLALGAKLHLTDGEESRELPLKKFYRAYKTLEKTQEEYIGSIAFEPLQINDHFNFEKISKRTNLDIASVNTAIRIRLEDNIITQVNLSAGGVGPTPMFLQNAADYLKGRRLEQLELQVLVQITMDEIAPISDVRGSADYKRLLLGKLVHAHFIRLFPRIF